MNIEEYLGVIFRYSSFFIFCLIKSNHLRLMGKVIKIITLFKMLLLII
nr:MAG TPA: hypothetical protein [Caudoviricetes sp.]